MRKFRSKEVERLYKAAVRSQKAKHSKKAPKKSGPRRAKRRAAPKRKRLTARGKAKAAHVMREFYAHDLTSHGHRVVRPDMAKAIAMSEGRAVSKPKRRRRRRKSTRMVRAPARAVKRATLRRAKKVIKHAAPKTRKVSKKRRSSKGKKAPTAKQLAARAKFVAMVRARAADKKGPNRRKR